MPRPYKHGPRTPVEQEWWDKFIDPTTQKSFLDMSDGIEPRSMKKKSAERTEEESKAVKKYNCLREKRHWLWAKYRNAEVVKRIHKPTEAQKAKTKLAIAARRAKDEVAFKAQNAKKAAACRNRRTPEKVEIDKAAALASLAAKDREDPTRIPKRKRRQSELAKARRAKAKQALMSDSE